VQNLPKLVATYRDGYPDMVTYSEGKHSGPLRYVTEEAAKRIGYVVEWKHGSFKTSMAGLADGSVDIVPYIFYKTPERELESWFSTSLGLRPRPVYFMVHRNSDAHKNLKTFEDLARYKIGFRGKSYYFSEFHAADNLTKVAFDLLADLAQGFIHNKVDVMAITDKWEAEREMVALGYDNYEYAELKFEKVSDMYYFYSRLPAREAVLKRFDQAVVQLKKEGMIDEIYRSFDVEPPQ
jgi:ABC-type amino acid transport substrate-binding protein